MATYQIYKELSLPAVLTPNSIYLIASAGSSDHVEIYVTGLTSNVVRRVLNEADIQAMINLTIAGANELFIVDDIAARDALNTPTPMTVAKFVFVLNATADTSVIAGGATYIWNPNLGIWSKVSEGESMDLILQWTNIQNRPLSSVAAIDDAVGKAHVHANTLLLDKIGEDVDGHLTYNGTLPVSRWETANW